MWIEIRTSRRTYLRPSLSACRKGQLCLRKALCGGSYKITANEHARRLGRLSEALPKRHRSGAHGGLAIYNRVRHLSDECRQRDDVTGHLLLELHRLFSTKVALSVQGAEVLTPSFNAAQLRIMQKSMAFQKTLAASHRPNAVIIRK